ncbi:MAG TPA: ThiF family adenylyltransferase [Thermoanaerobaculia bacterium]
MTRPDYGAAGEAIAPYLDDGFEVVGEWHRHDNLPRPSGGDVQTLRDIEDQFPGYLCVITSTNGERQLTTAHSLEHGRLEEHTVVIERYEVLSREMTRGKSLLIHGAGSGEAAMYTQTLKLGFQHITINDPDVFEERNLERHIADRTAVGKSKTEYLKRFARGRTKSTVRALQLRIDANTQPQLEREIQAHDVVLNATGDPLASLRIDHMARRYGKTVIHAAVFSRGRGGFVFIARPDGACYADAQQLDVRTVADDNATMRLLREQYGYTEEELAAQVGLWADVTTVAALQLKVLVEHLKGKATNNLYIIDNERLTIEQRTIARRPNCICNGGIQ